MQYEVVITEEMERGLMNHLLEDRSMEQMAVTLCGVHESGSKVKLLGRHLITLPPEAFKRQSSAGLKPYPEVNEWILRRADAEGLSQVDWHSHPGSGQRVSFSGIDDRHEREMAVYLSEKIPGTYYGSVVVNSRSSAGRVWEVENNKAKPKKMRGIRICEFRKWLDKISRQNDLKEDGVIDEMFARQVLAFGRQFQEKLRSIRIGIVGLGGLGSIVVEQLARLGVSNWTLIDDDRIDKTNLNRLLGATHADVEKGKKKVNVARRNILRIHPGASVKTYDCSFFEKKAINALKQCDLLVASTDNQSSRFLLNKISVQYLIPLLNVGVNISVNDTGGVTDISGEYSMPRVGEWCLLCGGIVDGQVVGWELADDDTRRHLKERGYVKNIPTPAVYHLNSTVASMAVAEIHNLVHEYKPSQRYLVYDALKAELTPMTIRDTDECVICSPDGSLGLGDLAPLPDFKASERLEIPTYETFAGNMGCEEEDTGEFDNEGSL